MLRRTLTHCHASFLCLLHLPHLHILLPFSCSWCCRRDTFLSPSGRERLQCCLVCEGLLLLKARSQSQVTHLVTEKVSSTTLVRPAEGNLVWSVYIPVKNKYQSPPLLPGSLGITKAPVTSADTVNVRTINVSVPRRNSSWVRNSQWNWHPAGKDPGMSVLGHIEGLPGPVFCVPCSSCSTLNVSRSIPELWEQLATDLLSWIRWTCPMFSWTRDHSSRLLVRSCPHAREHPWALVIDMTFRASNGCP